MFQRPARETDIIRLPSGDWIDPSEIEAMRVSSKPNRATGEVAAFVYISAGRSWFTVPFERQEDAHAYMDALAEWRNILVGERRPQRLVGREQAASMISEIAGKHAQD